MKVLLMFVLCLLARWAHAETTPLPLIKWDMCGRGYQVYHVNGIFTDQAAAAANTAKIASAYGNAHEGHVVIYRLAYNQTRGMQDLADSFKQVALAFPGVKYSDWLYAVWTGVFGGTANSSSLVKSVATMMAADIDRPNPYQDADLVSIQAAFNASWRPGARALIVGHSQGTLYTNLLYGRLLKQTPNPVPPASLGLVLLAAATSSVHGGGTYVTGTNDAVINMVRLIGDKNTLKGTIYNSNVPDNYVGHNLIKVYLNSLNGLTVSTIKNQMYAQLHKLKSGPPYNTMQPGRQTYPHVNVTWNNCGPASGNPYPCNYYPPGATTPIVKTVPYYGYFNVGPAATVPQSGMTWSAVDGSLAAAESAARSLATQCQAVGVAEYQRQMLLGLYPSVWVKGCFPHFNMPGPAAGYHYDDLVPRTYRYTDAQIAQYQMFQVNVSAYLDPVCRLTN